MHLMATHGTSGTLIHWARPGIKLTSSWILVGFITTESRWELLGLLFNWTNHLAFKATACSQGCQLSRPSSMTRWAATPTSSGRSTLGLKGSQTSVCTRLPGSLFRVSPGPPTGDVDPGARPIFSSQSWVTLGEKLVNPVLYNPTVGEPSP